MLLTPISRRRFLASLAAFTALLPFSLRATPAATGKTERLQKWQCTNQDCDPYIYDPSKGDENVFDPDNPIPPGIDFKDLPDDWICPVCADPKRFFVPAGEWVEVTVQS